MYVKMSENNTSAPTGLPSPQKERFAKIGFAIGEYFDNLLPDAKDAEFKEIMVRKYLGLAQALLSNSSYYNIDLIDRIINIINGN